MRRAVVVAARGDHRAALRLARLVVATEADGLDVVAIVDTADWREAYRLVGADEADVIIGKCGDVTALSVDTDAGPDVPARRRRPQPVAR